MAKEIELKKEHIDLVNRLSSDLASLAEIGYEDYIPKEYAESVFGLLGQTAKPEAMVMGSFYVLMAALVEKRLPLFVNKLVDDATDKLITATEAMLLHTGIKKCTCEVCNYKRKLVACEDKEQLKEMKAELEEIMLKHNPIAVMLQKLEGIVGVGVAVEGLNDGNSEIEDFSKKDSEDIAATDKEGYNPE